MALDETARKKIVMSARHWMTREHGRDDGFAEWYWNAGREDEHSEAYAAWLTSPARIEWWAERNGIFVGKSFARWYLKTGRTDPWSQAYEVFRSTPPAVIVAELKAAEGCPVPDSMV